MPGWRIDPLGEAALLATREGEDTAAANASALALSEALNRWAFVRGKAGIRAVVPAIDSVLVAFDPLRLARSEVEAVLQACAAAEGAPAPGQEIVIEARFGRENGPDLPETAAALGVSEATVVDRLCARSWRVMLVGYAPGWPYMGPLTPELTLPRRETPRAAVPAGSVALAAGMAGIYPARLPGGWHIIGRTDVQLFDADRRPPALLRAGDHVRFRPI